MLMNGRRYMEYKLVVGSHHIVENQVNELIQMGWRLHGPPSLAHIPGSDATLAQALIRDSNLQFKQDNQTGPL